MFPLTISELAQITEGELRNSTKLAGSGRCTASINNVSIDTRSLSAGDLFIALKGNQRDGHNYLQEAFDGNAIGSLVCSKTVFDCRDHEKMIVAVQDTLQSLQKLARWNRNQSDALIIGITGSVGKTTTRNMIHAVLCESFAGTQSPHNYNNQIGVPLSLVQLNEAHEFAVIEFGASAPGEIAELASWAEPEIRVLTKIGPAHLDGFGSMESIIQSKAELLDSAGKDDLMLLPYETACIPEINCRLSQNVITTGQTSDCQLCAQNVRIQNGFLCFTVDRDAFQLRVPGKHFLDSALIAIGLARELGLSSRQIQDGFDQFKPLPGRCELKQIGSWTILDDSYNSSPLAVHAALEAFAELSGANQRIAVLGDMLGLGHQSEYYHREVGQQAANSNLDFLITYGDYACDVANGAHQAGMSASRIGAFNDFNAMQEILSLWLEEQAHLLIKGSRDMHMERLLDWLEEQARQAAEIKEISPKLNYRKAG